MRRFVFFLFVVAAIRPAAGSSRSRQLRHRPSSSAPSPSQSRCAPVARILLEEHYHMAESPFDWVRPVRSPAELMAHLPRWDFGFWRLEAVVLWSLMALAVYQPVAVPGLGPHLKVFFLIVLMNVYLHARLRRADHAVFEQRKFGLFVLFLVQFLVFIWTFVGLFQPPTRMVVLGLWSILAPICIKAKWDEFRTMTRDGRSIADPSAINESDFLVRKH